MRYKVVTLMLGISLAAVSISGCSGNWNLKKPETEAQTETLSIEVMDMEVVSGTEAESQPESGDLTDADEIPGQTEQTTQLSAEMDEEILVEDQEIILDEETEAAADASKEAQEEKLPAGRIWQGIAVLHNEEAGASGEQESETEPDISIEIVDEDGAVTEFASYEEPESETESLDEAESMTESETEPESEIESPDETGSMTEAVSEPESEDESEGGTEPTDETEGMTESVSEPESEDESESETEPADETGSVTESAEEPESEMESESETEPTDEPESITEPEDETESETESESEEEGPDFELGTAINRVNVRTEASTDTESKALLRPGSKVIILEDGEDGWSMIKFEAESGIDTGYVRTEYLVPAARLRVASENVNVRSEPNADSAENKLGTFEGGEEVPVLGETGEWSEIPYEKDGAVEKAYVKTEFLSAYDYLDSDSAIIAEYKNMLEGEGADPEEVMAEASAQEENPVSDSENELPKWPKDPVEAQFALAKWLVPDMGTVGIIYTKGNKETRELAGVYGETAQNYGMELVEETVTSLEDIDLAAAELVGEVYGILLIDDEIVNSAVNIVTAYADEVGIPVIGLNEEQVKNGAAAAIDNGTFYFSRGELEKLGIYLDVEANTAE